MEASPLPTSDAQDWAERFNRSLQQQRERIREFLAAQQQRLGRVEAELAGQVRRIGDELAQTRDATREATDQVQQRSEQLAREQETLEELKQELDAKQDRWEQLQQQTGEQHEAMLSQMQHRQEQLDSRWDEILQRQPQIEEDEARLRHDRDELEKAQEKLQRELDERPTVASEGGGGSGDDEYRRRYEMSLEDIEEIKAEKAELQRQLAAAAENSPMAAAPGSGGTLDWEAEKQRILASLESDYDGEDEEETAEKLKIEEVIQTTERSLSEKDREVDELKHLLENQSGNLDSMAVGAAALGEMLDQDAIVMEERERLKTMQDEWQDKLRKAEVDISVERAKIARDRAEIEEKLRVFEEYGGNQTDGDKQPEKPVRGRWLERLGLKDTDEQ